MAARQELRGFPYQTIAFDVNTTGDHELRALVTGKHIVVMGVGLVRAGSVNARFKSGASDSITGDITNSAMLAPFIDQNLEYGLFWTAKGEALNLNLDANILISGYLLICIANDMPPTLVI